MLPLVIFCSASLGLNKTSFVTKRKSNEKKMATIIDSFSSFFGFWVGGDPEPLLEDRIDKVL